MKQQAIIKANNGFISEKMSYLRALIYAYQLKALGNYNVEVEKVEQ